MTELNDITAGTYLLVAEFWDEYLSKPGEPFDFIRHKRGKVLTLNVEDARRLVVAQAVIPYDPENPTHVVNSDGSISEIPKPDPSAGLVITQEQLEQLGLTAKDATGEQVVAALQHTSQLVEALTKAQEQADGQAQAVAEAQRIAREAVARAEAAEAAAGSGTQPEVPADRPKSDGIQDILDWVGTDKEKAATALEGERSTTGDRARPRLVGPLEELLTAPDGGA